jgi:hypothetical protein
MRRRRAILCSVALAYRVLQWRGRTYGSTWWERTEWLPGDGVVRLLQVSVTHAATLSVPPEEVWPWLQQVGGGRAGWYTPAWVDRAFFPANRPSAWTLLPEHGSLAVGDAVPDGPPETECAFTVLEVDPDRAVVLHSTSHLPLSWRRRGVAAVDWSWTFALRPVDEGRRTRLLFRWRSRTRPWWMTLGVQTLLVPADAVMSEGMLRGLEARLSRWRRTRPHGHGGSEVPPRRGHSHLIPHAEARWNGAMVMIDVDLTDDRLRIHFTTTETVVGLVHDLDEPLDAVSSVTRLRDPWREVHGWRTGLGLRRVWMLGTWWRPGHRQLVALRRDRPAVRIRLREGHYDELLVSTPHPDIVVALLHQRGVRDDRLVLAASRAEA